MRATLMYRAGDVRVEKVPDAVLVEPMDALVAVSRACICGSDLWPYQELAPVENGRRMGHEAIGVVEAVGAGVSRVKRGDLVVVPFAYSDGTCVLCQAGLQTSCVHGGFFGVGAEAGGAQAEALRVPNADGTLFVLPTVKDDTSMASLLTLADVMGTGHHAAMCAQVHRGGTVAVIGDGAVGLCGVLAAKRLGAGQIVVMGHHPDRIALAKQFGATDIVRERGKDAIEHVRELTRGFGARSVLECVGSGQAMDTAMGVIRPGGAIGRVGVPHYEAVSAGGAMFYRNITLSGGPAPVRAYMDELLPDILEGRIEPGRVFDRVVGFDEIPQGYRDMAERKALKVMIRP